MSKTKPLFSIITVVYNAIDTIERTFKSIFNQTFDDYEFIVIDGGSTDGTIDVIKRYEHLIDYWISEKDFGIYDAMNKGIYVSKGEWIHFLNAGDIYYNIYMLTDIIKNLVGERPDLIIGKTIVKKDASQILVNNNILTKELLFYNMPICHQAVFFNSWLFSKYGYYDLHYKIVADYEWLVRIFHNIDVNTFSLDKVVVYYLDGGYSTKHLYRQKIEKYFVTIKYYKDKRIKAFLRLVYELLKTTWYLLIKTL